MILIHFSLAHPCMFILFTAYVFCVVNVVSMCNKAGGSKVLLHRYCFTDTQTSSTFVLIRGWHMHMGVERSASDSGRDDDPSWDHSACRNRLCSLCEFSRNSCGFFFPSCGLYGFCSLAYLAWFRACWVALSRPGTWLPSCACLWWVVPCLLPRAHLYKQLTRRDSADDSSSFTACRIFFSISIPDILSIHPIWLWHALCPWVAGGPVGECGGLVPQPPWVRLLDVWYRLFHSDAEPAVPGTLSGYHHRPHSHRGRRYGLCCVHFEHSAVSTSQTLCKQLFGSWRAFPDSLKDDVVCVSKCPLPLFDSFRACLSSTWSVSTFFDLLLRERFGFQWNASGRLHLIHQSWFSLWADAWLVYLCTSGKVEIGAFRTYPEVQFHPSL